jgi:hypothetical protein
VSGDVVSPPLGTLRRVRIDLEDIDGRSRRVEWTTPEKIVELLEGTGPAGDSLAALVVDCAGEVKK